MAMSEQSNDREPVAPTAPEAGDCCGDGCPRCVNDVYGEALGRYQVALTEWRERQRFGHAS